MDRQGELTHRGAPNNRVEPTRKTARPTRDVKPPPRSAASAYTHPLADVQQTKHIVDPAAYAALALELDRAGDPDVADGEIRWAIAHAPAEVRAVLLQIPARQAGKSRWEAILYALDAGIRARTMPKDA